MLAFTRTVRFSSFILSSFSGTLGSLSSNILVKLCATQCKVEMRLYRTEQHINLFICYYGLDVTRHE